MSSVLVLDENINPVLRKELAGRGLQTETVTNLGMRTKKDDDLLEELTLFYRKRGAAWVLVTCDSKMPLEHRSAVLRNDVSLAVLEGAGSSDHEQRDRVHRWAHRITTQPRTVRRYFKNKVRSDPSPGNET